MWQQRAGLFIDVPAPTEVDKDREHRMQEEARSKEKRQLTGLGRHHSDEYNPFISQNHINNHKETSLTR